MARIHILVSLLVGTVVYVCLSCCFGPEGLWAYSQLEEQKFILLKNVQNIASVNDDLTTTYLGLRVDADMIAGYAKKLGYVSEGEKLVKLSGIIAADSLAANAGDAVKLVPVLFVPEWVCKLAGIVAGSFFLLLFGIDSAFSRIRQLKSLRLQKKAERLL